MDNFQKLKFNILFRDILRFYEGPIDKFKEQFIDKYFPNCSLDSDLEKIIDKSDFNPVASNSNGVLSSIFSKINFGDKKTTDYVVPLNKLELCDSIFPKKRNEKIRGSYNELWKEFIVELDSLNNYDDFDTILALVKKYASTICYDEDISLFNHLKTTVAISNCLYLNESQDNEEPFLIINGDLSGIQKFIYRVSSPSDAQKGMSKRLRGRSLYLTLITESICEKIISDLNLDSTNILFCGGGRFTIIAPNNKKTHDEIAHIDEYVNGHFIEMFNAELYLILVKQKASFKDLNDFGLILSELSSDIAENKKHKFFNQLEDLFILKESTKNYLCSVCGNEIDHEGLCSECEKHSTLGRMSANSKYLIVSQSNHPFEFNLFGINYVFLKTKKDVVEFIEKNSNDECCVYTLNDTNFLEVARDIDNENVSYDFKFMGNNVPNINGNPLYFEHLANLSKGANKLGVLKMDVDNLGKIFSQGFDKEDRDSNIFRVSSLSFYLDLFFSGMINQIIDKFKVYSECGDYRGLFEKEVKNLIFNEHNDVFTKKVYIPKKDADIPDELDEYSISTIYVNYSGGDDLLVLGPYDDIIEFALEFRTKFKEWTAYNSSINISAGVSLFNSKFPIGKAAIIAEEYLKQSKECGRDKITIFNQTLSWTDKGQIMGFEKLFDFAKELEELTEKGKLSNGFTYSLMKLWESNNDLGELTRFTDEDWYDYNCVKANTHSYVPKYYYKLRLVDKEYRDYLASKFEYIPWIKMPVSWVSLRLRG